MSGNDRLVPLKQPRQLVEGEPAGLTAKGNFQPLLTVLCLVEEEFGAFGFVLQFIGHDADASLVVKI